MSMKKHDDQCPGCMPAILDVNTGKALPDSHPAMKAIISVWNQTTRPEREAFHDFTCLNSRDAKVMNIIDNLQTKFSAAIKFAEEGNVKDSKTN
jgi:hypothetical protein